MLGKLQVSKFVTTNDLLDLKLLHVLYDGSDECCSFQSTDAVSLEII